MLAEASPSGAGCDCEVPIPLAASGRSFHIICYIVILWKSKGVSPISYGTENPILSQLFYEYRYDRGRSEFEAELELLRSVNLISNPLPSNPT